MTIAIFNPKIIRVFLLNISIIGLLSLAACTSEDEEPVTLIGTWKLIEMYSDPGDGSGDFMPVNSNRVVKFFSDGTISSNGEICTMSTTSDKNSSGTFDDINMKIEAGCEFYTRDILYEIKENRLIFWYPCIEGCAQKFVKI